MKEKARIISINNSRAILTCTDSKSCGSCAAHGICGGAKDRNFEAAFNEEITLKEGDEVEVLLPTGRTIGAAFMVMIFPLLLFFVFYVLTKILFNNTSEGISVLAGMAGIAIGFLLNFLLNRKQKKESLPQIIKKL